MRLARQFGLHSLRQFTGSLALVLLLAFAATWSATLVAQESICANDLPCEVPDVVGWTEILAQLQLARKHLTPNHAGSEPSNQARGTVLRTNPEAGTPVVPNSRIDYWTASGENLIPDLGGLSEEQARMVLRKEGFALGSVREQPSDGPARIVLTQDPFAGSLAKVGSPVEVTLSSDGVVVPDVMGQSEAAAIMRLRQAPLQPTRSDMLASAQPRGTVLRMQPPAGTRVKRGDSVAYMIASGQNVVPDLRGRPGADAPSLLASAGFQPGATDERADLGPPGSVLDQSPAAGSLAVLGTAVAMTLARELHVPDVVGRSSDQALAQLQALGLIPQAGGSEPSTRPKGEVLRSNPVAGTRVREGARVAYVVASGSNLVPDVRGDSIDAAKTRLADAGFRIGETTAKPDADASGRILEQDPQARTLADLSSQIALTISSEYPLVPPVVGKPEAEAMQLLQQAGFVPRRGEPRPSPQAAGIVLETEPIVNSPGLPGTIVDYWPASGENLVPETRTLTLSVARQRLQAAGFVPGQVDYQYVRGANEQVHAQWPQAGDRAPLGSGVSLTVDSGVPIVPDLTGKALDEAATLLRQAGLATGATAREFRLGKAGLVFAQQPAPGTRVAPDSTVALRLSRSPAAAGITAAVLLFGLGGAWWTLWRPWPLKLPLHIDARLEPFDAIDVADVDAIHTAGRDAEVALSAHLEYSPIDVISVPIVEKGKAHG